jgi:peptide/nickel transport system substrate-binding protein
VLVALSFIATGCRGNQSQNGEISRDRTLVIADPGGYTSFDPHVTYDGPSAQTTRAVYEGLVAYKGTTTDQFEAKLAETWESSTDKLTWTFHLRKGVKFHDGTPFNAEAVKFSFDRLLSVNKGPAWMFASIKEVKVVDEYTAQIILKEPYAPFLEALGSQWGPLMVSSKAVKDHEKNGDQAQEWLQSNECGTGPYTLVRATPESEVVLKKFNDYWGGWSGNHVDQVIIRTIREPATRRLLLESGEIDIANRMNPTDLEALKTVKGVRVDESPSLRNLYLFVVFKAPWTNPVARQALAMSFDYDAYVKNSLKGHATRAAGPIPVSLWGHDDSLALPQYDSKKAGELFKQAGVKPGTKLQGQYLSGFEDMRAAMEVLQAGLAQNGIQLEIKEVTGNALTAMMSGTDPSTKPDFYTFYWYPDFADPLNFLVPIFHSASQGQAGFNGQLLKDPEIDRLLDESQKLLERDQRIPLYKQIQQKMVKDNDALYLVDLPEAVGLRDNVQGYAFNPVYTNTYDYYHISRTK